MPNTRTRKKNEERYECPEKWDKYFCTTQTSEFISYYNEFNECSSREERLNVMEKMFLSFGGKILKKQKIDYHNCWKIDFIEKYVRKFLEEGVYSKNESVDEMTKKYYAHLFYIHLDLFFNEIERLKLNTNMRK